MNDTLKTDPKLLEQLRESAQKPLTKDELEAQRVSFVFGNLPKDSPITRERVAQKLKMNEGA